MWGRVLGQEQVKAFLEAFLQRQERPHALLFSGPNGVGKRLLAAEFARSLLCLQGGREEDCQCPSCKLLNFADGGFSKAHPDFIYMDIGVFGSSKATTVISIEQIGALRDQGGFAPVLSPYKVCLINNADKLSAEAAAGLLKLLEEPTAGWLFILVAERAGRLLPTIRSRAVRLNFAPLPEELLVRALVQRQVPAQEARTLARLAEGSLGLALELSQGEGQEGGGALAAREQALAFLEGLPLRYPLSRLEGLDLNSYQRPQALLLAISCSQLLHDILLLQEGAGACIYNLDREARLSPLAARFARAAVRRAYAHASRSGERLAGSVGVRLALEQLLLQLNDDLEV